MSELTPDQEVRQLSASQKAVIRRGIRAALALSHAALAEACVKYKTMYGISYDSLRLLMNWQLPEYLAEVPNGFDEKRAPGKPKIQRKPGHLTSEEASTVVAAYREALADRDRFAAISRLYAKFAAMYGVSHDTLKELVALDERCHAAEYRALREVYAQEQPVRRGNKKVKQESAKLKPPDYYGRATYCPVCHRDFDANFMPRHGPDPHGCKGSGKFGVTRYTIDVQKREEEWARRQRKKGKRSKGAKGGVLHSVSVRTVSGGLPGLGRRG